MKKYIILLTIAITLILGSCNSDGIGIFYKISVEPPLSTSELSEKSIYKVVNDGTDTYVLAGGTIYKKNGSDWAPFSTPSGEIQAVSLANIGATIYSIFADNINSTMYELSGSTWVQATGTSTLSNSNDLTLVQINGSNTEIFVNVEVGLLDYEVYSYNGVVLTNLTGAENITMQIVSSTRNGSGNYYLVSSNMTNITDAIIYTVSNLTVPPISVVTLTGLTAGIGSIVYDSVNLDFYASGKDGILYASDLTGAPTALTWTAVNTPLDNLKLGPMNIVDIGGTDYLLIGSDGGFYEMELPLGTPVSPTSTTIGVTEYLSIDLYMNTIFTILGDGSDAFYIGSSNGLWYSDTISIDLK